jgi:hypothetical protein
MSLDHIKQMLWTRYGPVLGGSGTNLRCHWKCEPYLGHKNILRKTVLSGVLSIFNFRILLWKTAKPGSFS